MCVLRLSPIHHGTPEMSTLALLCEEVGSPICLSNEFRYFQVLCCAIGRKLTKVVLLFSLGRTLSRPWCSHAPPLPQCDRIGRIIHTPAIQYSIWLSKCVRVTLFWPDASGIFSFYSFIKITYSGTCSIVYIKTKHAGSRSRLHARPSQVPMTTSMFYQSLAPSESSRFH